MILNAGGAGKAKAVIRGKGANLPGPPVGPLTLPVTAQLVNSSNNVCFEGIYDSTDVKANTAQLFRAKAQPEPCGTFLSKWGSAGSGDGQFDHPFGVAVDGSGNVFVADGAEPSETAPNNNRIQKFACP